MTRSAIVCAALLSAWSCTCDGSGGGDAATGGGTETGGGSASGGGAAAGGGGGSAAPLDAGSWSAATVIDDAHGTTVSAEAAASFVIWAQATESTDLWANRFDPALRTWGTPTRVSSGTPVTPSQLGLAAGPAGQAVAVWADDPSAGAFEQHTVSASVFDPSTKTWGAPELLSGDIVDQPFFNAVQPKVAIDSAGRALVVWSQVDSKPGTTQNLWARWFAPDSGWSDGAAITNLARNSMSTPEVAFDEHDNAFLTVAVTPVDTGLTAVHALRFERATQRWTAPRPLAAASDAGLESTPRLAVDGAGNAVVVWSQLEHVWAAVYAADAGWAAGQPLEASPAGAAALGGSARGDAWAVWSNGDGGALWARHFTSGAWAAPVLLASGVVAEPAVAVDHTGVATAAWTQREASNDGGTQIAADRFVEGAWATPASLEHGPLVSAQPRVAVAANNQVIVVWLRNGRLWASQH